MSGMLPSVEDKFARGYGLAGGAILTHLIKSLVDNGALSRSEARQVLSDALRGFVHPQATDAESVAAAYIIQVGNNAVPQTP